MTAELTVALWHHLPARATRGRRTDPAALAHALDTDPHTVSTALHLMERHGHAIRDRATGRRATSWHRGTPPPGATATVIDDGQGTLC